MRLKRFATGASAAMCLLLSMPAYAEPLRLDAAALPVVGRIDERFQSYNVEMAEIIGGRFWKPYAEMAAEGQAGQPAAAVDSAVALGANLFSQRTPADLSDRRLRALAAALGPTYVRVSGSWANTVYFQNDDNPPLAEPPEGYRGVLTRAQWRGALDFARAVDARVLISFAINPAVRDAQGVWTPVQARPLIEYTRAIGGEIYAAQLFNEPNLSQHAGGPARYAGTNFARDMAVFRDFAAQAMPNTRIVGPGASPGLDAAESFLRAEPRAHFDVYTYHFYPSVSQRCAPASHPLGARPADWLSDDWLATVDRSVGVHAPMRDRYASGAPIWITETAGAACGGAPWSAIYLDTFRYLDQMGRLAKQGVQAVFHNTLAASEYALIDDATMTPRPNYWAALLWRRLMGTVVLDAGSLQPGFHVYAHCLRDRPGGVALLAINLGAQTQRLETASRSELYMLSARELQSPTIRLNGRLLEMRTQDRLPDLRPRRSRNANITFAPHTIAFIALPEAGNARCLETQ